MTILGILLLHRQNDGRVESTIQHGRSVKYLALGDSYTIGTAIGEKNAYPYLLKGRLEEEVDIKIAVDVIAKNGWTTGHLLEGIKDEQPSSDYDVVTLLIGVNNQYQGRSKAEYRAQFRELLKQAIGFAGNDARKVFVLSIPDWSVTPAGKGRDGVAREIDRFNEINKQVADSLGAAYFNITPVSRTADGHPDLIARDGLHFSSEMQELWLNIIYKGIEARIMK